MWNLLLWGSASFFTCSIHLVILSRSRVLRLQYIAFIFAFSFFCIFFWSSMMPLSIDQSKNKNGYVQKSHEGATDKRKKQQGLPPLSVRIVMLHITHLRFSLFVSCWLILFYKSMLFKSACCLFCSSEAHTAFFSHQRGRNCKYCVALKNFFLSAVSESNYDKYISPYLRSNSVYLW